MPGHSLRPFLAHIFAFALILFNTGNIDIVLLNVGEPPLFREVVKAKLAARSPILREARPPSAANAVDFSLA